MTAKKRKTPAKKPQTETHIHQAPMLSIGASTEAVNSARSAIMDILNAPYVDQAVKVCALKTLRKITSVDNCTINNCSFTNKPE